MSALPTKGRGSFMFRRSPTHWHRGIDLAAREGAPVYAPAGGTVVEAYATNEDGGTYHPGFGGYGNVVVLQVDKEFLLFAHLQRVAVIPGVVVSPGDQIATVGTTAGSKDNPDKRVGPHLHFEVSPRTYPQQSEADRLDPVAWLREGRLHPLTRAPVASEAEDVTRKRQSGEPQRGRPLAGPRSSRSVCPCCGQPIAKESEADR